MSYEEINQKYDYEKNSSKQDLTNQLDDIINKYKSQLAELKTGNTKRNNSYIFESHQSKTIRNDISPNLSKEIQNDNIKLQSLLTEEKLKSTKLKAQIDHYEYELKNTKQELNELNEIFKNKENEYNQKLNDMETNINNEINDKNNIINENSVNINIIQNLFELYNKYIDIFYKSKVISFNEVQKLNYIQNDYEGNNQRNAIFVVNSFDMLIKKLLQDNKELYEQLIEVKNVIEQQNYIQKQLEEMKGIKEENLKFQEKIKKLSEENNFLKNDNSKLKKNMLELNNYIGNQLNNCNFNNHIKRDISANNYNNIYNYKNKTIHSLNNLDYNLYHNNNYNRNNNNQLILKNNRDHNKRNDVKNVNYNMNKKKLTINGINTNYTNRTNNKMYNDKIYSKTDENINKNNNYNENNKFINEQDITNKNSNKRIFSGYERPIEKLKKKIMILEQQIKNNPE